MAAIVDIGTGSTLTFATSAYSAELKSCKWSSIGRNAIATSKMGTAAAGAGTMGNATFLAGTLNDPGELDIEWHWKSNTADVYNGQGTTITFPSSYETRVLSGDWSSIKREAIETTHIGIAAASSGKFGERTYLPGDIVDPGEMTVEIQVTPSQRPPVGEAIGSYVLTLPNTSSLTCNGFCTGFDVTDELDGVITGTMKIKFTSNITVATATVPPIGSAAEIVTLTFPMITGGMTAATWAGSAFMTELGFKFGMDEVIMLNAKVKFTDNVTVTAAT